MHRLDPAGDGTWHLYEVGSGDRHRILGSLELAGRTLTASAMSVPRYQRLLDLLAELDVPLVEKSREVRRLDAESSEEAEDAEGTAGGERGGGSGSVLGPDEIAQDPEILAQMAAYIADYERNWCDEPVPALGWVTPRQAAADPTRRGDLIALLNSFPSTGSPLQMDGGRLKKALGLDDGRA
jgi:hypothetical protein